MTVGVDYHAMLTVALEGAKCGLAEGGIPPGTPARRRTAPGES